MTPIRGRNEVRFTHRGGLLRGGCVTAQAAHDSRELPRVGADLAPDQVRQTLCLQHSQTNTLTLHAQLLIPSRLATKRAAATEHVKRASPRSTNEKANGRPFCLPFSSTLCPIQGCKLPHTQADLHFVWLILGNRHSAYWTQICLQGLLHV